MTAYFTLINDETCDSALVKAEVKETEELIKLEQDIQEAAKHLSIGQILLSYPSLKEIGPNIVIHIE